MRGAADLLGRHLRLGDDVRRLLLRLLDNLLLGDQHSGALLGFAQGTFGLALGALDDVVAVSHNHLGLLNLSRQV